MTLKYQIVSDSNTLRAQYLENSWRCYGTVANSAVRQSPTVGYPRDSLASCYQRVAMHCIASYYAAANCVIRSGIVFFSPAR